MSSFSSNVDFKIKWLPFQLAPDASPSGSNKVQMYMQKFGGGRDKVMQMSQFMKQNFARVGLPYKFTDEGLVGNTFNAHRLTAYAFHKGGAAMQDRIVEALFHGYFAEEKFMNDPQVLIAAAVTAGIPEAEAKEIVSNEQIFAAETRRELAYGTSQGVRGVPHFVIKGQGGTTAVSGAQDPSTFVQTIQRIM